jgi:hypothetical protein
MIFISCFILLFLRFQVFIYKIIPAFNKSCYTIVGLFYTIVDLSSSIFVPVHLIPLRFFCSGCFSLTLSRIFS